MHWHWRSYQSDRDVFVRNEMIAKDDCVSVWTHSDNDVDHLSFQCIEKNIEIQDWDWCIISKHKNTKCVTLCHEYVM